MQINNLLRFDYWLDAAVINQPAGRAMWLVVIAGAVIAFSVAVLVGRGRISRNTGSAWLVAALLISAVGIGRIFAIPVLGLRLGWLMAGMVALAPVIIRVKNGAARDGFADDCVRALAFSPTRERTQDWNWTTTLAWLIFHLGGLAVIFTNIQLPVLFALPVLLLSCLRPCSFAMGLRRAQKQSPALWRMSALSPLVILYIIALLNLSGIRINGVLNGVLSLPLALIVLSAYSFVISGMVFNSSPVPQGQRLGEGATDQLFLRIGAAVLISASFAWSVWAALALRTHGVTGSDPYAYAQMGVDLATRGTVFHRFPLVEQTYALNISSYPVTHIGYRIPTDISRESATVWPPGYAVFTAAAWLVAGEAGLYLITPLLNFVALGVVGWFAGYAVGHISPRTPTLSPLGRGSAVAALTIFLTATSYQQVEWQMIPMADIAAQLFTLLAIGLALTARGSLLKAGLSGLALGLAFDIRYTQVLACIPIALALLTQDPTRTASLAARLKPIVVCALAALVAALPVLMYHQLTFGNALATGSDELGNFSLTQLPATLLRTLGELNAYREYGLLTPLILTGAIALWRSNRRAFVVLMSLIIVLGGFHVVYAYLRLRDILIFVPGVQPAGGDRCSDAI